MRLDDGSTITSGTPLVAEGFRQGDVVRLDDRRRWHRKALDVLLAVLWIRPLPRYTFVVIEVDDDRDD